MHQSVSSATVVRSVHPGSSRATERLCARALILLLLLAGIVPSAHAWTSEPPPDAWLVQVGYVDRQDPAAADQARIAKLEARLTELAPAGRDGAGNRGNTSGDGGDGKAGTAPGQPSPAARALIERELTGARKEAESRRGFIVYGSHMVASAKGAPIGPSRGTAAFLIPRSATSERVLGAVKPGEFVLVSGSGAKTLMSLSGRVVIAAPTVAAAKHGELWNAERGLRPPPPPADPAKGSISAAGVSATVRHVSTKDRENGPLFRYNTSVEATAPPDGASRVTLWLHLRFRTDRGETIGPILDIVEVPRGSSGRFVLSKGFDVIGRSGATLDPASTSIEVVAAEWAGG